MCISGMFVKRFEKSVLPLISLKKRPLAGCSCSHPEAMNASGSSIGTAMENEQVMAEEEWNVISTVRI